MALLKIEEPGQTPLPHQEKDEIAIGIDLGTTNSLVSFQENGEIIIIPDEKGNLIHPSIVEFRKNGEINCAHNISADENSTKVFSIKRLMDENSLKNSQIEQHFPHEIIKKDGEALKVLIENRSLTPTEISSYLLKYLKEIAQKYLKKEVKKAVITVPAYFDEAARNATKNAALLADLEVLRLINEPTSAAIAYGLDNDSKGTFAIFDLGGGTFDISILKLQQGVFKVIGVGGNSAMGGDDIDHILVEEISKKCGISAENNDQNRQKLRLIAKEIKEKLTKAEEITQKFEISGKTHEFSFKKSQFNELISDFVQKTIKITQNLIDDLEIDADEIKGVVLVGGSTRIPLVQEKLAQIFGENKILTNLDPDKIVAIGAGIQAHGLTHGSSNLLLDVVPLSLGIETMGGIVEKIIERNSTIPTSYSKEFTTYADNQTGMKLHILQGERELVEHCRSLAKFEIKGIPPLKAGVARVKVTFAIDADGLLTVSAKEELTQQLQKIEVKPAFGLDEMQIKEILINSARNAKDDIQKRLLLETKSEAKRDILAMESALKDDGNLLEQSAISEIKTQIQILEKILETDDKTKIEIETKNLEELAQNFAEIKMNKYIKESLLNKKIDELPQK